MHEPCKNDDISCKNIYLQCKKGVTKLSRIIPGCECMNGLVIRVGN